MLYKILENTPRELLSGVYKYHKRREKGEGLNPFWNRLKVEVFLCPFGQQLSFKCAQLVKNQRAILRCKSHKILKNLLLQY